MLRNLTYFWRLNVAVVLACAVACAVLTGALVVGDSVRGSLLDLTLERLGRIDYALSGAQFVTADLAERIATRVGDPDLTVTGAVVLQGSAVHASSRARASRVGVQGIGAGFAALFPGTDLELEAGGRLPPVVINESLRRELGAQQGDAILLSFARPGDAPRETLIGSRDTADVVRELRLEVRKVLPDSGPGRFSLIPHQEQPLLAFIELEQIQRALDRPGRVNTILATRVDGGVVALEAALAAEIGLADVGLEVLSQGSGLRLESSDNVLRPELERRIREWADGAGVPTMAVLSYIANEMRSAAAATPYSTIAGLDIPPPGSPLGPLELAGGGSPPTKLQPDEMLVNQWLADDLRIAAGDHVALRYFEVGPREELTTRERNFEVAGVVSMSGLGADRSLTPEFPGISDADDMADWDPPFPVDLDRIRSADEAYWDDYRAAPKAFFDLETAQELWSTRFGRVTSLRLAPAGGDDAATLRRRIEAELPAHIGPRAAGLEFEAVKERGVQAASGATDFGMLFIGFSLFLIVSAALLVALFFGLGVENRAAEIGLLLAVGVPARQVRRRFLAEGALLALCGVVLGSVLALGYAGALIAALRSLWQQAVGTTYLELHATPLSLGAGALSALVVVLVSIYLTLRGLRRLSVVELLRGVTRRAAGAGEGRRAKIVLAVSLVVAGVLVASSFLLDAAAAANVFFGIGVALLTAGLAWLAIRLGRRRQPLPARFAVIPMASRNASLFRARSLMSAALVASASFVIVAVAANAFRYGDEITELDSPAGGYSLLAEADVPVHADLQSADGLYNLGFPDDVAPLLQSTVVTPFRLMPGDDVSCLNLYQPESPRILGVPRQQAERGGFRFHSTIPESDDPWQLLFAQHEDFVPAFGDHESVLWILKKQLGDDVVVEDENGEAVPLRIVGLMEKGLFQSELLISEESFKRLFPSRTGYSMFLLAPPAGEEEALAATLERHLGTYGMDVTSTRERLQRFQAVFNTYLATFQTLGGLGLLLGTLGLAAILLRNVIERRGELATLRAFGFRRRGLGLLVLAENGVLLVAGLAIGTVAALIAVSPRLLEGNLAVPWLGLSLTLVAILAVGMLASLLAVRRALRTPLLESLKAE